MRTLLQTHSHNVISGTCVYSAGQDDQTGNQLVERKKEALLLKLAQNMTFGAHLSYLCILLC